MIFEGLVRGNLPISFLFSPFEITQGKKDAWRSELRRRLVRNICDRHIFYVLRDNAEFLVTILPYKTISYFSWSPVTCDFAFPYRYRNSREDLVDYQRLLAHRDVNSLSELLSLVANNLLDLNATRQRAAQETRFVVFATGTMKEVRDKWNGL